jgi:glutamine synthetase
MQGIISHSRAICAISLPTVGSYLRAVPGQFASAYTAWGFENREACLRVATGAGAPNNVEFRFSDSCGNPYSVMAALLAAGLDGMERGLKLQDPSHSFDFMTMSKEELEAKGIFMSPKTLDEAADCLEKDTVLMEKLGPLGRGLLLFRRHEAKRWGSWEVEKLQAEMIKTWVATSEASDPGDEWVC